MSSTDFLGIWLHVIGLCVYVGGTVALLGFVIPAAQQAETPKAQRAFLAAALRIYDPLMIAALGVVLMSGATNLTSYKDAFRGEFFARMGWLLAWKLMLAFLVFLLGISIIFGMAHRIVRNEQLEDNADPQWLASMSRRLIYASVLNLILVGVTTWLGLALGHPSMIKPG